MKFLATALSLTAAIKIQQSADAPPPSNAVTTDACEICAQEASKPAPASLEAAE